MLLTNKTKVLLTFTHTLLITARKLKIEDKGRAVISNSDDVDFLEIQGNEAIKYCEQNGCTTKALENYAALNYQLFNQVKEMYDLCNTIYKKHNGSHEVPFLYCIIMLHELKVSGLIGLDLEYEKCKDLLELSPLLMNDERVSKFGINKGETIKVNKYNKIYNECVIETIKKVLSYKSKKKRGKRK